MITDLSKLGKVQTKIDTSGKGLAVRFQVRDQKARDALQKMQKKLEDALAAIGWKPSLATEIATAGKPPLFELFEGDADYLGVDVRV